MLTNNIDKVMSLSQEEKMFNDQLSMLKMGKVFNFGIDSGSGKNGRHAKNVKP